MLYYTVYNQRMPACTVYAVPQYVANTLGELLITIMLFVLRIFQKKIRACGAPLEIGAPWAACLDF